MTSRERIRTALAHKEPDIVPIDFGGHRSSGIMVQAYRRLREQLGLPASELYVFDIPQQLAIVEDDVLDAVGADVVEIGHDYCKKPDYWQDWTLPDGAPCRIPAFCKIENRGQDRVVYGDEGQVICIQKAGVLYFEQTYFPLAESDDDTFDDLEYQLSQISWCRLATAPAPAGLDEEGLAIRRESAKQLRESTDRAIYATFGGNLKELGDLCFGMENFACELMANPARMHKFLDNLVEMHLANLEKYLSAVGEYIDIIGFGDDLGMQTGPLMSPAMYREFFKPRHEALWRRAKQLCPTAFVSLHSCGGIYPLLPDLIDAGLEVVNPVQFTCEGMGIETLKREFGNDIVLWGAGCDTRHTLAHASPDEVMQHVREQVSVLAPGGGFVFQQVHNIMADVPAENIAAMFAAVRA